MTDKINDIEMDKQVLSMLGDDLSLDEKAKFEANIGEEEIEQAEDEVAPDKETIEKSDEIEDIDYSKIVNSEDTKRGPDKALSEMRKTNQRYAKFANKVATYMGMDSIEELDAEFDSLLGEKDRKPMNLFSENMDKEDIDKIKAQAEINLSKFVRKNPSISQKELEEFVDIMERDYGTDLHLASPEMMETLYKGHNFDTIMNKQKANLKNEQAKSNRSKLGGKVTKSSTVNQSKNTKSLKNDIDNEVESTTVADGVRWGNK